METTHIHPRDVISYLGRDYVVEGILKYTMNGKVYPLAKSVDGDAVLWIEPLRDAIDDRLLLMTEISDLDVGAPPPDTISYRNYAFLPRLAGSATVEIEGSVPERAKGACELWRYRAAGDLYLQIEARASAGRRLETVVLFGEAIHKGMLDVFPGH